jgi:hypothetical protein
LSQANKTNNGHLNNLFDVQLLLGFCNYYQWFIPWYSEKPATWITVTRQTEPFVWRLEQQVAFNTMINAFATAQAICHFDHSSEVIIDTGMYEYVSAGVSLPCNDRGV